MKVYGKKILTPAFKCRFPDIQAEKKEGGYQIELIVPMAKAKEVQDMLYGGDKKILDFNKASAKAKVSRKLYVPVYLYDDEAKENILDDEGEKIESKEEVVFRFKSQFKPAIQFKKGLDNTAKIGAGSLVQISGSLFGSDEKTDENDKTLKYVLLTLKGVRVHELVVQESQDAFAGEENDDFEDEFINEDAEQPEEQPENSGANKSSKDF